MFQLYVVPLMNMPVNKPPSDPRMSVIIAAQQALELAGSLLEVRLAGVNQITHVHLGFEDNDADVLVPSYLVELAVEQPMEDRKFTFGLSGTVPAASIDLNTSRSSDEIKQLVSDAVVKIIQARSLGRLKEELSSFNGTVRELMSSIHILEPVTTH